MAIRFDYLRGGHQVSLRVKRLFAERPHFARRMFMGSTTLIFTALLASLPALAQYPGQVKQNQQKQILRAVGVLEWTGDRANPKASRLIPVVLYDGEKLQDAGIYMARPAPLALESQVEYELKVNGKTTGLYVINSAGQVQGSWVGFGAWRPLQTSKRPVQVANIDSNKDAWGNENDDRPILHRKQHKDQKNSGDGSSDTRANAPAPDPDRPTLHRTPSSDDSASSSSSPTPAPDPDRPTLHKKTAEDTANAGAPAPDPDRPRLTKKDDKPETFDQQFEIGHVSSVKAVTDPDRPHLTRGKPENLGGAVLPTLKGLPPDMSQMVAVSDAQNRPEHLWSYQWANPADEATMKASMEAIAREALGLNAPPAAAPELPKAKKTAAARRKATPLLPPPPPVPLLDEQFRVFELAYGSGATMVLTARTDGEGAKQKFVTLICQPNIYGKSTVLFKSVTDASSLDDTPRMRLIDAVDVMADNRGELLFELRGATQREFALYRVVRGQVSRLFVSGPSSIPPEVTESTEDSKS